MDPKGINFQPEEVQILHITNIVIIKIVGFVFIRKTIHIKKRILQVNTFLHNKYFIHKILNVTSKYLSPNTSQIVKND
jgi:hypothetical protein